MNITVVGLGLIGGSFCKAISNKTDNKVFGIDINKSVINSAKSCGAICDEASDVSESDIVIVALYPEQTINFINNNINVFKRGSIVIDTCGVKRAISQGISEDLSKNEVTFIGAHPMAGKEFSGFDFSEADLFLKSSLILTPDENVPEEKLSLVRNLGYQLGFRTVIITSEEEHDRIIAYTSQLAHIVSSAYIKSSTAQCQSGYSAGSFKDLTRVAYLNEDMWTSLFMINKDNLVTEIDTIIKNLVDYRNALQDNNSKELNDLLKTGKMLKKKSMEL